MTAMGRRALAAAAGMALDQLLGEPPTAVHPVVWFGNLMNAAESQLWANDRTRGAVYAVGGAAVGALAGRVVRSTTAAVAITVAGRELRKVATEVGQACGDDDLGVARAALPSLVGRDPSNLDHAGVAAAAVESVAENTVDAVVAPVFWALAAGAPGAAAYRAINTMDAMVGHKNTRYRQFGWAAARLDDVANFAPARLFAMLVVAAAPQRSQPIAEAVRSDAPQHPSPNSGVAEAAVAGALGLELGGTLHYGKRVEHRPLLGSGPRPGASDVHQAVALTARAQAILAAALVLLGVADRLWERR